ncbi:CHY zinc finger protein [Gulosibacter sp. 10]|uniref:CHY zinc finger protein n=1 Tax=Gulosibacter sp. 10 TaxID=1255570 RepID=UPI000B35961D|nr:CHY zinc finger protein [Gulosibacter sp. 10]
MNERARRPPRVLGPTIDDETRCVHYHGPTDVIAIKFKCCDEYYPCHRCHEEAAGHPARQWPEREALEPAVLCGRCRRELPVLEYMAVSACPGCGARFNERCSLHYPLYFAFGPETIGGEGSGKINE